MDLLTPALFPTASPPEFWTAVGTLAFALCQLPLCFLDSKCHPCPILDTRAPKCPANWPQTVILNFRVSLDTTHPFWVAAKGRTQDQWKPPLRAERTRLCGPCSSHPFRSLVPPPLPVTVYNRPSSCAPLPRSDPASLVSWPSLQHGGLRAFACAVPSAPQWGSQGRVHSQYTGSPCTERLPLTP